ncbi:hypothetical protein [Actinokineospora inagensis]|uniref:hypothetical protein n=1 Tax=Actinokineospora inagensis TaxID=103730 RepID=UPI0004177D12|nr:hypothetical protein [Actinokineospora inagensis]
MDTALWIGAAAIVVAFIVWRLRRASTTLDTILREERERADPEPAEPDFDEFGAHHSVGRQHRRR